MGRIVLNVWRCARSELQLCSYSLQNVAYKLLGVRCPGARNDPADGCRRSIDVLGRCDAAADGIQ